MHISFPYGAFSVPSTTQDVPAYLHLNVMRRDLRSAESWVLKQVDRALKYI